MGLPVRNDEREVKELSCARLSWHTWSLLVQFWTPAKQHTGTAVRPQQALIHPAPTHTTQCALRKYPVTKRSLSRVSGVPDLGDPPGEEKHETYFATRREVLRSLLRVAKFICIHLSRRSKSGCVNVCVTASLTDSASRRLVHRINRVAEWTRSPTGLLRETTINPSRGATGIIRGRFSPVLPGCRRHLEWAGLAKATGAAGCLVLGGFEESGVDVSYFFLF